MKYTLSKHTHKKWFSRLEFPDLFFKTLYLKLGFQDVALKTWVLRPGFQYLGSRWRGVGRSGRNMWRLFLVDSIIIGAAGGRVNIFIQFQPSSSPFLPFVLDRFGKRWLTLNVIQVCQIHNIISLFKSQNAAQFPRANNAI